MNYIFLFACLILACQGATAQVPPAEVETQKNILATQRNAALDTLVAQAAHSIELEKQVAQLQAELKKTQAACAKEEPKK